MTALPDPRSALLALALALLAITASSQPPGGHQRGLLQQDGLQRALSRYLSNEELEAHLKDFVKRCGSIAALTSAGKSVEGRDLWVLELSDRPGQQEAEPNVKYVGNVHGDEPSGRVLALALAEWLCANHETDSKASRLVKDLHLFLMPTMNPDGFAAKTRENRAKRDLNRDFPDRYASPSMFASGLEQPETAAVMAWSLSKGFVASASFHEGAVLANYPWDGTPNRTTEYWASPDDAAFRHLAKVYAASHRTMHASKSFKDGITNGAAWYPIYGSMQDWSYVAGSCFEITLELSDNKWPPEQGLAALWEDNRQALVDYALWAALGGLRGAVKAQAGSLRAGKGQETRPLPGANITVVGIDWLTRSRQPLGDFYRPLAPGQYGVLVAAEGYTPFSANVTVPEDGSGVALDVVLLPLGAAGSSSGDGGRSGGGDGGAGGKSESESDSVAAPAAAAAGGPAATQVGAGAAAAGGQGPAWQLPARGRAMGGAQQAWGSDGSWGPAQSLLLVAAGVVVVHTVRTRLRHRQQLGARSRGE